MRDPGPTVTVRVKTVHQFDGVTRHPGETYDAGMQYVELLECVGHVERITAVPDPPRRKTTKKP